MSHGCKFLSSSERWSVNWKVKYSTNSVSISYAMLKIVKLNWMKGKKECVVTCKEISK